MPETAKILVVDDELPVCKSIASALSDRYTVVDCALSGEEALKKDTAAEYDVVISDLMMPGISGMDLLNTLKRRRPDVLVILVTGYPSIRTAVQAIRLGAFDYLPKPFTPVELRSMVDRALATRALMAPGVGEEPLFRGEIPAGRHAIQGNAWIAVETDSLVRIGPHHALTASIRKILNLELPAAGEMRYQGEVCLRITDGRHMIHRLWSPVTGEILEVNGALKEQPELLAADPYGKGWVMTVRPSNLEADLKNLVSLET
jgi:CheY-like chemotaxis protein/glycine cleavage system H lipoate-binding protein